MNKFAEMVSSLLKSLTGGEGNKVDDEDELNVEGQENENENEDENNEENEGEGINKSDVIDITQIMKSLVTELKEINKSLKTLQDSQGDVGNAVVGVAELVARVANIPVPTQSVMGKSTGRVPGLQKGGAAPKDRPTIADLERVQVVLAKAYREGKIDLHTSSRIESDMQKAIRNPNFNLRTEDYDFLMQEIKVSA
ncbi:MAG: hypothetical protein LBB72_01525 [Spirochaetaceae bacterium]|jgi:hypothetical protein|nr:hypothetical protein [Spirochaetaceae bacterium]